MSYLFKYYAGVYDGFMQCFQLDHNDAIIEAIGPIQHKRILDIGGGTGTLADKLQKKGASVTLIDPSPQMSALAQEKNPFIKVYTTTLDRIDKETFYNQFDVVILRDALHHIPNQEETIKLAYEMLKSGGQILIGEFDLNTFSAKLIWFFETLCLEKCKMFTKERLMELCSLYFTKGTIKTLSSFEILYIGKK